MKGLSLTLAQATSDPAQNVFVIGIDGPAPGKPRMTQRDKWKQRPCVMAYRAWADRLRAAATGDLPKAEDVELVVILARYVPPASWSLKKQAAHIGEMMRSKPDGDNVAKSVFDALWSDDQKLGDFGVQRRWAWEADIRIEVFVNGVTP